MDLGTALDLISGSVEECDKDHAHCPDFAGTLSGLPSRVLDVRLGQENDGISLVETNLELGIFVTLSHCWGKAKFIQTTKATLEDREKNIPFNHLPQAFQDAVAITRRLGVRYLWINSLCIIQDVLSDWEIESSRMASIFSNSWLNLASSVRCGVDRTCPQSHGV
jgi:hypothetical protein